MTDRTQDVPSEPSSTLRTLSRLLVGVAIIATAVGVYLAPWRLVWSAMLRANVGWLAFATLAYGLVTLVAAMEWQVMVPARAGASWARMLGIVALTYLARNTLTFFGGEISVFVMLTEKLRLKKRESVSVLLVEQAFSGFGKVALIGATAAVTSLPMALRGGAWALVWAMFAVAVLWAVVANPVYLDRIGARLPHWPRRALHSFAHAAEDLDSLRSPRKFASLLALSGVEKAIELCAITGIQLACGIAPSLAGVLLVSTAVNVAVVVPGVPANFGLYEAAIMLAYDYLGVPSDKALTAALLQHMSYLLVAVGGGYLSLALKSRVFSDAS